VQRLLLVILAGIVAACSRDANIHSDGTTTTLTEVTCRDCRIVAETLAYLGDSRDTLALSRNVAPTRDSRGRYYLASQQPSNRIYVFEPSGRLLTEFGKPGQGPGELSQVFDIQVGAGDSIYVFEESHVHVFSPEYAHVRQFPSDITLISSFFSTPLLDGTFLRSEELHTFAILRPDGTTLPQVRVQEADTTVCDECGIRIYREGSEPGTVWSGATNTYSVDHHDLSGKVSQRFTRIAPWVPTIVAPPRRRGGEEAAAAEMASSMARPRFMGAAQSSDGLLWTHVMVVPEGKGPSTEELQNAMDSPDDAPMDRLIDKLLQSYGTYVEVIDPERRELLASEVLPGVFVPMQRELAAQFVDDTITGTAWRVVRFTLRRTRQ
jgi:hypothetical protein